LLIEYAKKEKFHKERNSIYVQRDFLQQILHVKKKKFTEKDIKNVKEENVEDT